MTTENGFNVGNGTADDAAVDEAAFTTAAPETGYTQAQPQQRQANDGFDSVFFAQGLRAVSPPVEDYIKATHDLVKLALPECECGYVDGYPNFTYFKAINQTNKRPVVVVFQFFDSRTRDERDIGFRRDDIKNALVRMGGKFHDVVITDLITILPAYKADMQGVRSAAEAVIQYLNLKTTAEGSRTVEIFKGKTLAANYDVHEALSNLAAHSPHGVLPRIETAATYQTVVNTNRDLTRSAKVWNPNDYSQNSADRPVNVFTIGGYIEIGRPVIRMKNGREEQRFETFYHITAMQSRFSVLGMLAMGLSAFSSHIINDYGWVPQFYNKKANGDLGMLMEDADNPGNFVTLGNNEETMAFARRQCWPPVIIIDGEVGFDLFPGLNNLTTDNQSRMSATAQYLAGFFGKPAQAAFNGAIARFEGTTLEGYYGDENGTLFDTRRFDWFMLAQTEGVAAQKSRNGLIMRTMTRDNAWPIMRFNLMRERLPNVIPHSERTMHAINPAWLNWVSEQMRACNITIRDTSRPDLFGTAVGAVGSDWMVDTVVDPTTTLGGSTSLTGDDVFNV